MNLDVALPNIGDSIVALPTIDALRPLKLRMANREVAELLPTKWQRRLVDELPADEPSIKLDIWLAVMKYGRDYHPTQILMSYAGLLTPIHIPRPRVVFDEYAALDVVPEEDLILLAPWSKDPRRAMTFDEAQALADALKAHGNVVILGAQNDPRLTGVQWYYGSPLGHVLALMKRAKMVITTDSACNRLAHAADIDRHILLTTEETPIVWQAHPKAYVLQGARGVWHSDYIAHVAGRFMQVAAP
ncbi:MAG: hypothetical protein KGL39_31215 [Patescibacteria group bacterium]|nr:hypothetical protein [Patescibacteria group bacterium]